ncbi:MAG: hypothetical protein FGF48_10210 [Candidatus Brockarchaeota archaeon]|nr:hypothetical protein [Candidatus Brockarchaeota archaeon]
MSSEENPLLTLPRPIVDALFASAEKEARNVKERILILKEKARRVSANFLFNRIAGSRRGCVAVADGSMSVAPSNRIGSLFAIYSAGYMVFDGDKLIDENYYAGSLSWPYGGARDFKTLLKLLMAYAERKAALEAYWKHNPDIILLDGPFFFFRGYCRYIHAVQLETPELKTGLDLVKEVRDKTLTLMGTGRAICVIRRSGIRAIDGWIIYNQGEDACLRINDKHLLTMVMPPMSTWSYRDLCEDPLLYATFYRFYRRWRQAGKTPMELDRIKEQILSQCLEDWKRKFVMDLNIEMEQVPKLERHYVRYTSAAPPFEIETLADVDAGGFAEYFVDFHNPATGLPHPTDLIDEAVTLPRGSTTAFTEEVEARLIRDREIEDKTAISDYFTVLNPQKKEYV